MGVSDLLDYSEPSSRAFLFENLLLLVVPTATICSSKGMIPLETIKRDITTLGIVAKSLVISMGTNQTGKRFYQVKVKSPDTTSIKELGRLMEPLQMQAFRKTYGKILELTIAEVSIEAIASLTQYYDQPLRCFTFGDFQLVPTIEEFEEILGCPLGGRKPYLSSGCLPSLSRIATVVKDSARGLDRIKQTRNGIAGLPQKYLEDKARGMANQGEWVPFMDVLALLIFGVVLFPNVDGLVGLAAIDAFLAYHHSKESPVVAVLADLFDTFDRRCEKSSARIICCLPALCVWLVSHLFQQDTRHPCPLLSHRSCTEKRRMDWDQLLAGIGSRTISWFPRWKEGKEGVLFSCGRYPNIPLVGTRGCINYNPTLAIRQLGYPMRGAPTEESMSPFLVRDLGAQNSKTIQRIHKAWETPLRKDQELRGIRNGIIGGYHEWLKVRIRGLDWLAKLKVVSEENFEAPEEDEEVQALKSELGKAKLAKEKFKLAATHVRKECAGLREENAITARALERETKRARKEEYGRNKFRGALWGSNNELKLRREERDQSRAHSMVLKEELVACSRSKRSLSQRLREAETNMLAIIAKYQEELGLATAHEHRIADEYAQVYAEKEARGRLMEKNAATAAAVSSAAEADPTLLATTHHPPSNIVGRGRDTLGHDGSPHLGYNRAAYPYGLPPNYSPPILQEDAGHIASPVHEKEPPQQPDEVHKDPQDYARRDVEFYPPIPEGPAPGTLPQPNIAASPILVGYMPSSFAALVFAEERIEVGLKRGKFDYVSSTNVNAKRIGATGAKRKEGDAHAVSSTPAWVKPQQTPHGTHQYAQHHPSFSAHAGNASSSTPVQPKAPTQREAPQVPTPNTARPAGNSNTTRNFPPRPLPEFTPLLMTFEDLLPSLIANHLAVVTPGRVLEPHFPKWYDPNATCKYHGGAPGHSVEKCLALKYKVQHLMDAGWLTFQEDRPNVRTNPLANHGGGAVNAVESDRPHRSKPLRDVATPRRFIFEALQKGGVIPHSGCKEDSCLLHSGEMHDMETCLEVEELLQRMIDQGRLEVGIKGKEEQHICMQSTEGSGVAKPKPLVIYFTKSAASQKPGHPLMAKPVPFPYQNSHAVPWRYTPPGKKEEEVTDVSSLSAKVTNITGLSGKDNGGITSLIKTQGNRGKYGLGYKPTQADMKRSIAGRKNSGQSSRWRQESEGSPPCHISRSFISAGLGDEGQVFAICEDGVPSTSDLVRPCPPDFQLGNWRVEERPGIYATSIISRLFRFFRRFPQINVGGDSARIPFVEHASRESRVALPPKGRLRQLATPLGTIFRELGHLILCNVSDLLDYSEPSSRAFLFENLLLLVVPTATICSSKGMIPLETIKRDITTLGIVAKSLALHMGSVLIPAVNQPTEGPCRLLKNVRWGISLPLDVVSKKGTNSPDPRIRKLHLCHMHFFMHSSIPPMRYRSFDLHQLLSHFSKHGNKSNRQEGQDHPGLPSGVKTKHERQKPIKVLKGERKRGWGHDRPIVTLLCAKQAGNVAARQPRMAPRKLASKRSRKDKAAEGTSSAPEYDSHRFRSAVHQQRFEAIKGWSFLRERRVQLRDDEYTDFQEEIGRRRWAPLVTPMAKFDPEIVLEFYANAWPTKEGVRDMRSWVRGQWIPFDADAISQLLGYPMVLEEGQECEYGQRRNRSDGFDEEAIAQLLCIPGQDFARTAAGRRVRIMRTSMAPTRHPLDPDKSNRALGFPALITGLCQSFGVPVAPTKVIRPPITRAFIEKYCTQRQAQGDAPQAAGAPPPPHQAGQVGAFDIEQYLRHLVRQQAANHRAHSQGFASFSCPTPDQFRAEVAWPGDWPEAQAGEAPPEAPGDGEEAHEDEEMADLLDFLGGSGDTGENNETFSSLTSYPELRRSEFLIGGYVGARASLLSTTPPFVAMTQELVARGDTLWLFAPFCHPEAAGPMTSRDQVWSFCTHDTRRYLMVIRTLLSSRGGGPDDKQRPKAAGPMTSRDQVWSFCTHDTRRYLMVIRTLLSSRGGGPDDKQRPKAAGPMTSRDQVWSFCTHDTRRYLMVIRTLLSSRGGGPDDKQRPKAAGPMTSRDQVWSFCTHDTRRYLMAAGPMTSRDQVWSFCTHDTRRYLMVIRTLLSSRGGGPDDKQRPKAAGPMTSRDQVWSFCTLVSSRGGGPDDTRKYPSGYPYKHSFAICPLGPSRRFLQKAVASGGSNPARLGELGGNHLPYFAINRGGRQEGRGFNRSSTFSIRSSSFFDLQRVSTSNQAFRFILCTRSGPHCVSCIFILVLFTFYTPC
ncbi:hypothetical protein HKD37_15G043444 [Glycine soja]